MSKWPTIELDEIIVRRNGSIDPSKFPDENFELYSIPSFDAGGPEFLVGSQIGSSKQIIQDGDVLLSKIVPHIRRAWVVNRISQRRLIASGEWIVFRSALFDANYLRHALTSDRFHSQFMQTVSGVGGSLLRARPAEVAKIKIALPPLEEQKRIAAILDKADSLRRKRAQAIALADDFLRATFLDLFGDPVTNPKGWPVHRMGDLVEFKGGSQPPKDVFIDEPRDGYVRLIQIRDFKSDKYPTYIPEKLAKREFSEDDVMIARYGPPVFQILRGLSGSYNVALMKAIPKLHLTKEFVFWLLQLPAYHDVVVANSERTAGQTGVNLDLLNEMQVPLPSLEVIEALDAKTRKVSDFIEKQSLMLEELNAMSAGLAAEYFS